jgi:hypothetical protein
MSNDKNINEEKTIEYVYIPDEGVYGTIVKYGVWSSLIEYYDGGIKYTIDIPNDEYIVIDEIGIGYISETEEGIGYPEEENDL